MSNTSNLPAIKKLSHHIFVCTNERPEGSPRGCCKSKHSEQVLQWFKEAVVKTKSPSVQIRAQKAGCLDTCEWGPVVVVYPEGIWYGKIDSKAQVEQIVTEHICQGQIVRELQIPGK